MGKIEEAIKKINTDMQKEPNEEILEKLGEYVIDHIRTEEDAEAVLAEDKSLKEIYDEIKKEAYQKALKKRSESDTEMNCVGIACEGERTLERVMKYFGLTAIYKVEQPEATKPQTAAEAPAPAAPKKAKEVNLDFDSFFA